MITSINERQAAAKTLIIATRHADEALTRFSTWLTAGSSAAFALVLARIETISTFIAISHIRCALLLFILSLAIAVITAFLSAQVKGAIAATESGEALTKDLLSLPAFDYMVYLAEFKRGLLPPMLWMFRRQAEKAQNGDLAAGARMIAKLSQTRAMLVILQSFFALLALGAIALGLKVQ